MYNWLVHGKTLWGKPLLNVLLGDSHAALFPKNDKIARGMHTVMYICFALYQFVNSLESRGTEVLLIKPHTLHFCFATNWSLVKIWAIAPQHKMVLKECWGPSEAYRRVLKEKTWHCRKASQSLLVSPTMHNTTRRVCTVRHALKCAFSSHIATVRSYKPTSTLHENSICTNLEHFLEHSGTYRALEKLGWCQKVYPKHKNLNLGTELQFKALIMYNFLILTIKEWICSQ